MATYNKFNDFTDKLIRGEHDWDAHTFKIALTNTAPVGTTDPAVWNTTAYPAPTSANGYPAGGTTTTISVSESAGTTTVQGTQVVFTATAGGIGQFRYAILYNDSHASKAAIAFWDYGTSITLNDTETFTVKFNNASPGTIFTLA
jgi:hypothetical protein